MDDLASELEKFAADYPRLEADKARDAAHAAWNEDRADAITEEEFANEYEVQLARRAAAEIRSLREQVAQERAGIVAWLRDMKRDDTNWPQHIALMIERHEDKEKRA